MLVYIPESIAAALVWVTVVDVSPLPGRCRAIRERVLSAGSVGVDYNYDDSAHEILHYNVA